ncbi:MAG: aminotransferase class I/II-fold pyridoxal phosphate-dependent enzyme [Prevotella sp.]|uniref:aminotransferase class I/II-fold pyridoxal phosphate-dependent enzyme n=1 Tax=Prevotella sp. TaxID=59823 RepID=UPI002A34EB44|nr:aminotransferase class I/II-fold pyridoxal phosphate-dependent enzyme [Prevotella sp.]MDD7317795.1 aminotransferase class I/II-fold pyridoxal phosphate-dependent enzyme [Prevotellaceae bacterium]MDY4020710.1 aminotransferase class I/II-fold pyridoxal phosphate-dependent enzyme [Prevotella sp.]
MIRGHGDDSFAYGGAIRHDFSSNVITALQPQGLTAHLQQRISLIDHYPQPAAEQLAESIAGRLGIMPDEVLPTNGATEAIYLVAAAYRGATSAIVEPTFSEYADACRINSHALRRIAAVEQCDGSTTMLWLCNPNNPTGRLADNKSLLDFARSHGDMMLAIDQSYEHATLGETISAAEAVEAGNIILIHSMTKRFAMPGLRLGFVTAARDIICRLADKKQPWSVNALAVEAGMWLCRNAGALDISPYIKECRWLQNEINGIDGIEALPSDTTFFLARLCNPCSTALKERLAGEGVLVRNANNFHSLDEHYLRIATQEHESNIQLLNALRKCIRL